MHNLSEITNTILCGDAKEELAKIPDESVDMCITSPPYYALRNYGVDGQLGLESNFDEYLEKLLAIIAEIKRVLKPTGQFWLNLGDIYGGTKWSGGGVGQLINKFKNGYRDINLVRNFKPSTQGDRMYSNPKGLGKASNGSKCLSMMPERISIKMIDEQGWILRNRIVWAKQILDFKEKRTKGSVMPSSVRDRFNESWEYLYFFVKNKKYYSDLDAVRLPNQTCDDYIRDRDNSKLNNTPGRTRTGGLTTNNFNYRVRDAKRKEGQPQFRASKKEIKNYKQNKVNDPRGNHLGGPGSWRDFKDSPENNYPKYVESVGKWGKQTRVKGEKGFRPIENLSLVAGKNLPTVWLIGSEPHNFKNELGVEVDHFATFPKALVEIPIKFGCPPKGIVLDPFAGSMTSALVAERLNRNWTMIELNKNYCKLGQKRIFNQRLKSNGGLFDLTPAVPPPIIG